MSISTNFTELHLKGAERGLKLKQQGTLVHGECEVSANVPNTLAASIDEGVIGVCELPKVTTAFRGDGHSLVYFSIQLDVCMLFKHVNAHITFTLLGEEKRKLACIPCLQVIHNILGNYVTPSALVPSYAFFGGGKLEPLKVDVNEAVNAITFSLNDENFLNIRQLKLFGKNNELVILTDESTVLTFSSCINELQKASRFSQDKGFHSQSEVKPWFTLTFNMPTFIDRIEVGNRADKWGARSRHLNITVLQTDSQERVVYDPYSSFEQALFVQQLVSHFGDFGVKLLTTSRETILSHINTYLEREYKNVPSDEMFFFLQFLSIWGTSDASSDVHELELKIFSFYVFLCTTKGISFTFLPFCELLRSNLDLNLLESEVNRLRLIDSLSPLHITKHGLAHAGMLTQNTDMVLRSMELVMSDLESMNLKPCLAYGTLLGAVRDNAFIPHDDDVDLFVECELEDASIESVYSWTEGLLKCLDISKYRTDLEVRDGRNLNIHILVKETGMVLDIFPYWKSKGKWQMHMEKMTIRGIELGIFESRSTVTLHNKQFLGPGKPEAFLVERYGDTWSVSDKYHEWPWALTHFDEQEEG